MKYKLIGFYESDDKKIQEYANNECEGNFNLAVRKLTKLGLAQKPKDKCNEQK